MDHLIIDGPCQLKGEVQVSCSKNSSLPLLTAALLCEEKVEFTGLPDLVDINSMIVILQRLGCSLERQGETTEIHAHDLTQFEAEYDLVRKMRASILVLGPLLSRFKRAKVSLPGGCAIGTRPIDIHLENLEKMGAKLTIKSGYVEAETQGLKGADLFLKFPSVGATENLMMAASLAKGTTYLRNAAREPEIEDLANFLNQCGAKIEGAGTPEIKIEGVERLGGTTYRPMGDRIEAATFLIAGLMTRSRLKVQGLNPNCLKSLLQILSSAGAKLETTESSVEIKEVGELKGFNIETAPYPGFPTDIQAQLLTLGTSCSTPSIITESIFENRFMHVPELVRMGAKIKLKGKTAFIEPSKLSGAPVMCTDLRASAALIIASLAASGQTKISRIYHLDRGYEKIHEKLGRLGARIDRLS